MLVLFAVGGILFWEYRQLQLHILKVRQLQAQYESYIASVQAFIAKQKGQALKKVDPVLLQSASADQPDDVVKKDEVVCKVSQDTNHNASPLLKTKQEKRPLLTTISFLPPMQRSHYWLSSYFGPRKKPNGQWGFHYGLDMAANRGTPIQSVADGVVEIAQTESGYGNTIVIAHDEVYKTRYAHLDEILVTVGQTVQQGDLIGKVGDTGFTRKMGKDASHLHLEVYENGTQINPRHVIDI